MKRGLPVLLILMWLLFGCQGQEISQEVPEGVVLEATVLKIQGENQLLVEPVPGSPELGSADRIIAHTLDATVLNAAGDETVVENYTVGSRVQITYDGSVAESYPAQIWAQKVQLVE